MKFKFLLICLLPLSSLFSGKIGLICLKQAPFNTAFEHPNELIKRFQEQGHQAEMVYFDPSSNKTLDTYDLLLTILDINFSAKIKQKTILFVTEPRPVIKRFSNPSYLASYYKVFTWNHDLYDGKKFFKGFFPHYQGVYPEYKPFNDRSFACLISGYLADVFKDPKELYTERMRIAEFYTSNFPEKLNLYGSRGWEKCKLSIYKGRCDNKHAILRDHKFCYCYENWNNDFHYISEKILHCLQNRCVPIYYGSSKITDYIPKETFIDARSFNSIEELHTYIDTMSEERWMEYIKAIEAFDRSPASALFRLEHYIESVSKVVNESLLEKRK